MLQRDNSGQTTPRSRCDLIIVEDEPVSRRALMSLVAAHGFSAQAFPTAEAALTAVATDGVPNVVLVDLNLPGINGVEFIRRIGAVSATVLPVLITAAGTDVLDQLGRVHPLLCFRKPLDFDRLLSLLRYRIMAN